MTKRPSPFLNVAIPVINEAESLPALLSCLLKQDYKNFRVFICVNQPEEWWGIPEKKQICEANAAIYRDLKKFKGPDLTLIDRFSRGNGWNGKRHGVGWARKTVMDAINADSGPEEFMVSLDADTTFGEHYFSSLADNFTSHPDAAVIAVPYFHRLTEDEAVNRAMLHYEIYMRYYSLNLWRIGSPYSFTALGSAMAFPVWAYRAVGGMTPKLSGEDFYFLQKLRKYGKMIFTNPEKVYPAARYSDRVYFGTGPAMIKGSKGDWSSYPIYSMHHFDEIRMTTDLFADFFRKTTETPVVIFLREQLKEEDPFQLLRENFKDPSTFARACHEKFDGLRILQFLKCRHEGGSGRDEDRLLGFLSSVYPGKFNEIIPDGANFLFAASPVEELDKVRNFLVKKEEEYQVSSIPSLPGRLLPAV